MSISDMTKGSKIVCGCVRRRVVASRGSNLPKLDGLTCREDSRFLLGNLK